MSSLNDLTQIAEGDYVEAAHIRLLAEQHIARKILPGSGVRVQTIPGHGTRIESDHQPAVFDHPWKGKKAGANATLMPGLVNTLMPWLADTKGPLRPMDGLTPEGEAHPKGVPSLALREDLFDAEGNSWIVVRAYRNETDGTLLKPQDGGLTLAQVAKRTWENGRSIDQEDVDGRHYGDEPLCLLRRPAAQKKGLGKLYQVSMFHKKHIFLPAAEKGATGSHLFYV